MKRNGPAPRSLFETLSGNQVLLTGVITSATFVLAQLGVVLFFIWQLPPEVPLFYSLPVGEEQLAGKNWLLLVPGVSLAAFVLLLVLIRLLLRLPVVFHQLMAWLTALVGFLHLVVLVRIIMLVL